MGSRWGHDGVTAGLNDAYRWLGRVGPRAGTMSRRARRRWHRGAAGVARCSGRGRHTWAVHVVVVPVAGVGNGPCSWVPGRHAPNAPNAPNAPCAIVWWNVVVSSMRNWSPWLALLLFCRACSDGGGKEKKRNGDDDAVRCVVAWSRGDGYVCTEKRLERAGAVGRPARKGPGPTWGQRVLCQTGSQQERG